MGLDRRTFLQQAALALISVGASEAGIDLLSKNPRFSRWLQPYIETLAQTSDRKIALLVGINEYSQKTRLHGCVNDVELQKELLVHRFGFKPQDVHILTDRQATRENIESAFVEYLKEPAQSNDLVLFHFSGYGSQVKLPASVTEETTTQSLVKLDNASQNSSDYRLVNSLVPVDSSIPNKGKPAANDLLESTLIGLGRSLQTENLVMVLDASFQETKEPLQGNLRVRSYNEIAQRPNPEELAFQGQIQRNIPPKTIAAYRKNLTLPGIILSGADSNKIALEGTWDNFSAGLLTYVLTQYLWQTMPQNSIIIPLQQAANIVSSWSEKQQQPKLVGKTKPNFAQNIPQKQAVGGEGFIKGLDTKGVVDLQMALPLALLDSYEDRSCFTIANLTDNSSQNLLQLRSREGITAKAQWLGETSLDKDAIVGKLIQEAIRIVPHSLGLSVALDSHLERIERVDATSALANIAEVKTVNTAGEAYADCLLGKTSLMVQKKAENATSTEKPTYSYSLYTSRGNIIPDTSGEANEVVKTAINRLEPYFKKLLAAKLLEFTVNQNSSTIPVVATLELAKENSPLRKKTSYRIIKSDINRGTFSEDVPTLERSSEIQLKIENQSDRDLYGIIVGVDSEEKLITLYSPQKGAAQTSNADNLKITAHKQLTIPQSDNSWRWRVIEPLGIARIYLIMAIKPFTNTLELIARQPTAKFDEQQIIPLPDSLEVAKAVMQDLHTSSAVDPQIIASNSDVYALDVNSWTSLKFTYDVT